ncbi:hypothetical protein DPMN_157382 [Dreissena polymorpha]|uniref:Uncharacterized protein n=1 Tax=Dreissena polymorpha TaxID=45954 RepID=A0A9D4EHZ4_DREPO|nr:hypothetical protein DPMN_157382 [Dreissena polymorpha]
MGPSYIDVVGRVGICGMYGRLVGIMTNPICFFGLMDKKLCGGLRGDPGSSPGLAAQFYPPVTNVRRKDQVGSWTRFPEGSEVGTTFVEDRPTLSERCWIHEHDNPKEAPKAEQTYFAIRGGKVKRVDAASVVEAASVCGSKSHFAAKLRICPPRHAAIRDMMPSQALLKRTVFSAACQPNKRQIENYLYRQRKKVHKAVSLVPYADSDNDDGDDSDNDDGDGTSFHWHFQEMAPDGRKDRQKDGWTTPKQYPSAYSGG